MIARGDIFRVRIEPRSGSEQRGTRPAIVISSDIFNANPRWNSLLIIPCTTSSLQGARPATVVPLVKGSSGLEVDGFAICHQITTLDRSKFLTRIGRVDVRTMAQIELGIRAALDML